MTVVCPGLVIVIIPPHMHMHCDVLSRAAWFAIKTVSAPGIHGAVVTGMQGTGVRTPIAADVAAATCGFDGVVHIPKGMMFTIGM